VNWVYEIIQDVIVSSLETGPWLPDQFELTIQDRAFKILLKGLVVAGTSKKLDPKLKRVTMRIQEHYVTVRSDRDPEPWLPVTRSDTLH